MIDLHLHTTASDGRCTPADLVRRAWRVGIRAMSVTDHDTRAGLSEAAAEAARIGMAFVPGIEVTTVEQGKDVHLLAFGLTGSWPELEALLATQRQNRIDRAMEIGTRLDRLGAPIDLQPVLREARRPSGKAIARPQIAKALVDAGHVTSIADAFDRFLGENGPAYVPHFGASPHHVTELVLRCGGVVSLAHPGLLNRDDLIPELVEAGMTCLEVVHSSHDPATEQRYRRLIGRFGLRVTGGSDYHGDGTRRAEHFGRTTLPVEDYRDFRNHLAERQSSTAS